MFPIVWAISYGPYDMSNVTWLMENEIYHIFWPGINFKDCAGVQAAQINPKILSSENFY